MKHNRSLPTSFLAAAAIALAAPVFADEAADKAKPPEAAPAPAPAGDEHKVTRGDLRATAELPAIVTAGRAVELSLDPKEWADLSVVSAVDHGTKVRKGAVLVVLETEKITEQIADTEKALKGSALTLRQTEEALRNLEASTPLQLEAAAKAQSQAKDDLAYYETTGRKQEEKSARWMVESAEQSLEGAEEELDQLTKMYEADDLTEETEEIVVKRARYAVDAARKRLDSTRLASERTLSTTIPRQLDTLRSGARSAEIAAATARATLPRALELKRLETAKAKEDFAKATRKFKQLQADLPRMEIRSPEDGYVYYGAASDGKWDSGAVVAKKLVPGGKLAPKEVFMTVVSGEANRLAAVVPEDKLFLLSPGTKGTAIPASDPRLALPARIASVAHVPEPAGGFLASLVLDARADTTKRLAPGMNVKVSFVPVNEKNVLTVPISAVFEKEGVSMVQVKKEAGTEAVAVKTGATDGKMIVVNSGLKEGDIVLTTQP